MNPRINGEAACRLRRRVAGSFLAELARYLHLIYGYPDYWPVLVCAHSRFLVGVVMDKRLPYLSAQEAQELRKALEQNIPLPPGHPLTYGDYPTLMLALRTEHADTQ